MKNDKGKEISDLEYLAERVNRQNRGMKMPKSPDQIYRERMYRSAHKENSTIELLFWIVVLVYLWWTLPAEQMIFKFIPHLNDIALVVGLVCLVPALFIRPLRKHCYIPFWWMIVMLTIAVAATFGIQWLVDHGVRR